MRTGRPKSFDEADVLEKAMQHFWLHGYQGSGLSELLSEMGISRQSLYDTFGNKRDLFIRVLQHYRDTQLTQALALLENAESPLDGVRATLGFFRELGGAPDSRGCLVANSIVEFGPDDDVEISTLLRETLAALRQGIEDALTCARERGELAEGKSPETLSHALTNAVLGLAVTGRLGLGQSSLGDVYEGTLCMLD